MVRRKRFSQSLPRVSNDTPRHRTKEGNTVGHLMKYTGQNRMNAESKKVHNYPRGHTAMESREL